MARGDHDVVVTGLGAVSALGRDVDALLEALRAGRSGIRPITRFDVSSFSTPFGAEVPDWTDRTYEGGLDARELCLGFAMRAAREAMRAAGLERVPAERIGLTFGTGLVDESAPLHELAETIGDELGILGPRLTVSTACSSSTAAIGVGRDLLALGAAEVVLAGGADVLTPSVFAGFHALDVLSPAPCAPFSVPLGTTLGEGAAFLVLERRADALRRGAPCLAALEGYGLSADGYHETSPDPEGAGVTRAARGALGDANLPQDAVEYVNAHGSGTRANDPAEVRGIRRALGEAEVPLSSSKGALGHAQGAAGALESVVTILGLRESFLPPTLNHAGSRNGVPADPVAGALPRPRDVAHSLCLNSAFGGSNAALLFAREPGDTDRAAASSRAVTRRPVHVVGLGLVGPSGTAAGALPASAPRYGRTGPIEIADFAPRSDPRGLDRGSRLLIAAATLSLRDAGVRMAGSLRFRTGLIYSALRASPESLERYAESIERHGLLGLSAAAFARIVLNAPAGFCSKELGLRGPHTALCCGGGSGLLAMVVAAELLATRPEAEVMLGTAVDELAEEESSDAMGEWAVAVALAAGERNASDEGARPIVLSGWGLAGPGRLADAVAGARRMEEAGGASHGFPAGPEASFADRDYADEHAAARWATPSALAFSDAITSLRQGRAARALVTADAGTGLSLAALLHR